ncbi:hypothetical protein HK18_02875 [Commensalibacter intestini]|uniref:Uncharacterized protein n=1 Tax=Commensalibacter intestini TaxID=479936 RepID=A0A251ZSY2_9PROT|nr:hypothetical protein [Commensalibacter intestini]OUI77766.1 hypothetical protein HK18_02875 [Commensalibacter intestini]
MKKIKLMADYFCYPLWDKSDNDYINLDPNTLPISNTLKKELMDWSDVYDGILNMDDPASSGFKSSEDKIAFIKQSYSLYERLQTELGSDYEIEYFSDY